jgi:hypothetical protein
LVRALRYLAARELGSVAEKDFDVKGPPIAAIEGPSDWAVYYLDRRLSRVERWEMAHGGLVE